MRIVKFYCDHCGKECPEHDLLHCSFGGARVETVEADLCPACVAGISGDIPRARLEEKEAAK